MTTTQTEEFIVTNEIMDDLCPVHPGIVLEMEVLPAKKVTGSALAQAIGATRPSVAKVLNGKGPVTAFLAARIEAATGYPASLLLRMQSAFDLAEVKREKEDRLREIPRIAASA